MGCNGGAAWRLLRAGTTAAGLTQQAEQPASHDNLFHSFLGLFDVHSQVYQRELDLFQPCRASQAVAGPAGMRAEAVAALR